MKNDSVNDFPCWNPDGKRSIERLKEMFVDINQKKLIANGKPPAPRAVFRKQHGIATGRFSVLPLPDELKSLEGQDLGVFNYDTSKDNSFECILRFSSDIAPNQADLNSTIGIGMKLFGEESNNDFFSAPNTDFIFQNIDRFFVKDADQMCQFTTASMIDRDLDTYLEKHPETKVILGEMSHPEGSCLTANYWAIIPFKFGDGYMVKYRLRPVNPESSNPLEDKNYLSEDLHSRLLNGDYRFHFEIQVKEYDAAAGEDLQHTWKEPFYPIAEVVLPQQNTMQKGLPEFGNYLNFNIWRVPTQNLPFGTLAEARREVYKYSAETRYSANGWNMREPESTPCPYHAKSENIDDCIVRAAIYPPIGIMRIGNSDEVYPGPLVPDPIPNGDDFYRDKYGRLKRQTAEFRIYGLNANGEAVRELTGAEVDDVEITWSCHLANQKAAWYDFNIALDIPEAKEYPASNPRNMNIKNRDSLVIDGGEKSISCIAADTATNDLQYGAKHVESFAGTFLDESVYLGDMFVKPESNRLYLVGGKGKSENINGEPAITFANNEGWYDDVSDGPVTATVSYKGEELQVEPAWVICGPPDYAPMQKSVRTMWDLMRDLAVSQKMLPCPQRPSLKDDILPIFMRMADLQWVNRGFSEMFGYLGPFNFTNEEWIERLSDQSMTNLEFRRTLYNQFRQFELPGSQSPALWPWLYGDAIELPPQGSPRQHTTLTSLQLRFLEQWVQGDFVNDLDEKAVHRTIDEYPVSKQPDLLTRAALDFCLADAFHPGCEMTWPVRMPTMYRGPFRFAHDKNQKISDHLDYGATIDYSIVMADINPFGGQVAGGITRWMAIPWQTDTSSCRDGYDTIYDPYLPTFWPARVPNNILGYTQYQQLMDEELPADQKMEEFRYRKEWLSDLPGHPTRYTDYREVINKMVTSFDRVGVVLQEDLDVPELPEKIQVAYPKTLGHLCQAIHDLFREHFRITIPVDRIRPVLENLLQDDTDKIGDMIDYIVGILSDRKKEVLLKSETVSETTKSLSENWVKADTNLQTTMLGTAITEQIIEPVKQLPEKTYVKPGEKVITIHERFRQQLNAGR